jgi:two-component system, cell cycle sensor histidine kinase and response regulator CckA
VSRRKSVRKAGAGRTKPGFKNQVKMDRFFETCDLLPVSLAVSRLEDHRVLFANKNLLDNLGISREEVIGRCVDELRAYLNEEDLGRIQQFVHKGRKISSAEMNLRLKSGKEIIFLLSVEPIVIAGEKCLLSFAYDITKLKKTEDELKKSEEKFKLVADANAALIAIFQNKKLVYCNESFLRVTGYSAEEAYGLPGEKLAHLDYHEHLEKRYRTRSRGDKRRDQYEIRILTKSGEERWVEMTGDVVTLFGEELTLITAYDVSERKKMEEALRKSEQDFKSIFELAPYAITITDLQGNCIDCNQQTLLLHGVSRKEEILGKDVFSMVTEEDRPRALENTKRCLVGEPVKNVEYQLLGKNGETFSAELSASVIRDSSGKPERFIGVTRDISGHKRIVDALRTANQQLMDIIEFLPDATLVVDQDKRVIAWNRAMEKLTGVRESEMIGKSGGACAVPFYGTARPLLFDLTDHPDPGAEAKYEYINRDGDTLYAEVFIQKLLDGQGAHIWIKASPLFDEKGHRAGWIETIRDVSERKKVEEERRVLDAKIQQMQKVESLGVLAGGVAHDFNNLLTGILGYSTLVLSELPLDSPARKNLHQIELATRRATELTEQMLAYSGRGKLVVQATSLPDVAKEMIGLLKITIQKKSALECHFEENLPPMEADVTQLRQVIMNLIINASEAIGDKKGKISIRVGMRHCDRSVLSTCYPMDSLAEGMYLYVEVRDNGCGMTSSVQSRIFEPFFSTKFTGRGLGLASVLGIVRGHRGAISVESVPDVGTTFTVYFPPCCATPENVEAAILNAVTVEGSSLAGKVLVIDDEASIRDLVGKVLTDAGFSVLSASGGREGIELFRLYADVIRFVLLDVTMPDMDGKKVLDEMRSLRPNVKAILSSGFEEGHGLSSLVSDGFIQKPYSLDDLMRVVKKVIGISMESGSDAPKRV